jgi:citrate/tricarballylate utilization protein
MSPDPVDAETRRQLEVCNACRYCEGVCAVFPALERRSVLTDSDIVQLAHLCHDCRACFDVCPYAPPHLFAVNLPREFAARRDDTIRSLGARATRSGPVGRRGPRAVLAWFIGAVAIVVGVVMTHDGGQRTLPSGSPYRVVGSAYLLIGSGVVGAIALLGLALGGHRYWRAVGGRTRDLLSFRATRGALADAASLRYLRGGGIPCTTGSEAPAPRRLLHQLLVVGLGLCFGATIAAAVLADLLDRPPPYGWASVPVLLGTVGGVLLVGPALALRSLDRHRDRAPSAPAVAIQNAALLDALAVLGATGLAAECLRSTEAGAPLLVVHLVVVWSTLLVAAWSKLAHAQYRLLALVRDRVERSVDA